jgi:hypothetical protein
MAASAPPSAAVDDRVADDSRSAPYIATSAADDLARTPAQVRSKRD